MFQDQEAQLRPELEETEAFVRGRLQTGRACGRGAPSARLWGGGMVRSRPVSFPHLQKLRVFLKAALTHSSSPGGGGEPRGQGPRLGSGARGWFTLHPWGGGLTSLCLCSSCVNGTKAVPAHGADEAQLSWFS